MGDRLTDMRVFTRVARLGGFAAAARELRLSTTAVSRRVSELEAALGARLLRRTTRRISLTEEGHAYLERCERVLEEIDDLESTIADQRSSPRGRLRLATGVSFGQEQVVPLLPGLLSRHPELVVDLELSDRFVDLVADGIDVAIRIGRLADSSLVARRLATCRFVLCAAPDYLERAGRPDVPEDLVRHDCVVDRNIRRAWEIHLGPVLHRIVPDGPLHVNSAHAVRDAALAGMGIALAPTFVVGRSLASGDLVELLPECTIADSGVYAVYPPSRHLSSKVRVFVDHVLEHIGDPPTWDCWKTAGAIRRSAT